MSLLLNYFLKTENRANWRSGKQQFRRDLFQAALNDPEPMVVNDARDRAVILVVNRVESGLVIVKMIADFVFDFEDGFLICHNRFSFIVFGKPAASELATDHDLSRFEQHMDTHSRLELHLLTTTSGYDRKYLLASDVNCHFGK